MYLALVDLGRPVIFTVLCRARFDYRFLCAPVFIRRFLTNVFQFYTLLLPFFEFFGFRVLRSFSKLSIYIIFDEYAGFTIGRRKYKIIIVFDKGSQ